MKNYDTALIREFGDAIMSASLIPDKDAERLVKQKSDEFKSLMENIKDFKWLKEPEFTPGPQVDKLQRFRTYGWHGVGYSAGYDKLHKYFSGVFACHRYHIPEKLTLEDVREIIAMLNSRLANQEEDYYDD